MLEGLRAVEVLKYEELKRLTLKDPNLMIRLLHTLHEETSEIMKLEVSADAETLSDLKANKMGDRWVGDDEGDGDDGDTGDPQLYAPYLRADPPPGMNEAQRYDQLKKLNAPGTIFTWFKLGYRLRGQSGKSDDGLIAVQATRLPQKRIH